VSIPEVADAKQILATWPPEPITVHPPPPKPWKSDPTRAAAVRAERKDPDPGAFQLGASPVPATPGRPSHNLAAGAAASAIVSASCLFAAGYYHSAYLSERDARQAATDLSRNRTAFVTGTVGGVAAAGLLAGAVFTGRW